MLLCKGHKILCPYKQKKVTKEKFKTKKSFFAGACTRPHFCRACALLGKSYKLKNKELTSYKLASAGGQPTPRKGGDVPRSMRGASGWGLNAEAQRRRGFFKLICGLLSHYFFHFAGGHFYKEDGWEMGDVIDGFTV